MFPIIIIYVFLMNSIAAASNSQLNINVGYGENDTLILSYNITTNYSYFITYRSFGDKQLKLNLLLPAYKPKQYSFELSYQYETTELFNLFIICFHFILQLNDLDIQCKDIRLLKKDQINPNVEKVFLPSYNPLFVPMMYALSVLMLLPVIIQHHRRKKALVLQRRTQLRRLSITIAQDDKNPQQNFAKKLLSHIVENGDINYGKISDDIELVSMPSTNTILGDCAHVTFTLQNLQPFTPNYNDNNINEESGVNADDCIAHLLDSTPWTRSISSQPLITSSYRHKVVHDSTIAIKEPHVPTRIPFHDDDDDDQEPILKSNNHSIVNLHRTNRAFFESDV